MPDLVANLAFRLLEGPMDPVPRYRLLRDILQWPSDQPSMLEARDLAMRSHLVQDLCAQQLPDGSWGKFRLAHDWPVRQAGHTTETALIRARALGMDGHHPVISQTVAYLTAILNRTAVWPDLRSSNLEGPSVFELAVAARLSQLDVNSPAILPVAAKWQAILEASLSENGFDRSRYREIHEHFYGPSTEMIEDQALSSYNLILLRDRLAYPVEVRLTDYLINQARGIFLVNNRSLRYLPLEFKSRECQRYLVALDLIADYPSAGLLLEKAARWLWEQMNNEGLWDFDQLAKDGLELPLSESWRRRGSRGVDCTVRILNILVRLQRSCEIRKMICHVM